MRDEGIEQAGREAMEEMLGPRPERGAFIFGCVMAWVIVGFAIFLTSCDARQVMCASFPPGPWPKVLRDEATGRRFIVSDSGSCAFKVEELKEAASLYLSPHRRRP